MPESTLDQLTYRVRPQAGEPEGALVLLHGRGTSEHDLYPLLDMLDPAQRLYGATPRGPLSLPPGGAHWYAVGEVGFPDPDTFTATFRQLAEWLDALSSQIGVPHDRIVLGGFSQGAVMSYALALGAGRPELAGVIALSGFMPSVEGFELDIGAHKSVPFAIGHGSFDPVIAPAFSRDAAELLQTAGLDVLLRESPIDHTVDPQLLGELRGWLIARVP